MWFFSPMQPAPDWAYQTFASAAERRGPGSDTVIRESRIVPGSFHAHEHHSTAFYNSRALARVEYCPQSWDLAVQSLETVSDASEQVLDEITLHSHPRHTRAVIRAVLSEVKRHRVSRVLTPAEGAVGEIVESLGATSEASYLSVPADTFIRGFLGEAKRKEKARLIESLRHQGPDESHLMSRDLLFRAQTLLVEGGHHVERWKSRQFDQIFEGQCTRCHGTVYAFKYERKTSLNPSGRPFSGELTESRCGSKLKFRPLEG